MSYSDTFNHIVAYLELCVTLHILNPAIFRVLKYLLPEKDSGIF